jgi:hypothetical protein
MSGVTPRRADPLRIAHSQENGIQAGAEAAGEQSGISRAP